MYWSCANLLHCIPAESLFNERLCCTFQDTVVAIQALAQYGYLTFSKDGQNTVEISSKNLPKKVLQVDNRNRLLLQQVWLPSLPGNYSVEVKGNGCVYLQVNKALATWLPALSVDNSGDLPSFPFSGAAA